MCSCTAINCLAKDRRVGHLDAKGVPSGVPDICKSDLGMDATKRILHLRFYCLGFLEDESGVRL
jgi:hypothetical protein